MKTELTLQEKLRELRLTDAAIEMIKERFDVADSDEHMRILRKLSLMWTSYLRYQITERFSALMKPPTVQSH